MVLTSHSKITTHHDQDNNDADSIKMPNFFQGDNTPPPVPDILSLDEELFV
jgi:hypothetical protein